eukprot:sb/3478607/
MTVVFSRQNASRCLILISDYIGIAVLVFDTEILCDLFVQSVSVITHINRSGVDHKCEGGLLYLYNPVQKVTKNKKLDANFRTITHFRVTVQVSYSPKAS